MKKNFAPLTALTLMLGLCLSFAPSSQAQAAAAAGQAQKLAALAKQLYLSPQQEQQLMPILKADAPKLEAVKNNSSLGPLQKMQQVKAIHEQTDPQIKAILNPQQYEQLQQIRQQEMQAAMEKKMGQQ